MGGEGPTPTPLTAPSRPGKVRRKWAKGERPAAESQPQGREGEELNLGGEGPPGSRVDKAPGPYARTPRRDSVSPAEYSGIIQQSGGTEVGETVP